MPAAEKASVSRQWRWMYSFEYQMFTAIDKRGFLASVTAPKHEYEVLFGVRQTRDNAVGEALPAMVLVRASLMCANCERGVEKQHALVGPAFKIAARRHRRAYVGRYLFENIDERRRHGYAVVDRKTQSMCLIYIVIRVLTQYHNLNLVERTAVEGVEDF